MRSPVVYQRTPLICLFKVNNHTEERIEWKLHVYSTAVDCGTVCTEIGTCSWANILYRTSNLVYIWNIIYHFISLYTKRRASVGKWRYSALLSYQEVPHMQYGYCSPSAHSISHHYRVILPIFNLHCVQLVTPKDLRWRVEEEVIPIFWIILFIYWPNTSLSRSNTGLWSKNWVQHTLDDLLGSAWTPIGDS